MRNLAAVLCLFISSHLRMGQVVTLVQDFKVSNTTADVYRPGIAVAPNVGFAVAWGDSRVGSSNRTRGEGNIYGNIFDGSGNPTTPNFVIDNVTVSNAYDEFSIARGQRSVVRGQRAEVSGQPARRSDFYVGGRSEVGGEA